MPNKSIDLPENIKAALQVVIKAAEPMRLKEQADCFLGTIHRNPISKAIDLLSETIACDEPTMGVVSSEKLSQTAIDCALTLNKLSELLQTNGICEEISGEIENFRDELAGVLAKKGLCSTNDFILIANTIDLSKLVLAEGEYIDITSKLNS